MHSNVFSEMLDYYESLAVQLTGEARQAGVLSNPTAVGTSREEIYRRFLKRHIPYACEVFRGGYLFDMEGESSKQIDLIVTSGTAPRFEIIEGNQANAPVEGTIAVVEIKSVLDKTRLYEALENFAEIPPIKNPNKALNPTIKIPSEEWWWDWPYKVIFAYDGIDQNVLYQHLYRFYDENKSIPQECRPSMIHVLGKYIIVRITPGLDVLNPDGSRAPEQPAVGEYRWFNRKPDINAMPVLFTSLQRNAFISNHMMWQYSEWVSKIAGEIAARPD